MEKEPLKVYCRTCHTKLDITELPAFSYFDCPECGTAIRVPEQFGRYLLEKICATACDAVVYRAIDRKLARRVTIRILLPEYAGTRDFYNTARLAAQIEHPAIVPILDCGIIDGRPYMATKLMERGNLEQMKNRGELPAVPVLATWLHAITSALAAAAEQSIVHHCVTPENMLVSAENEAMLGGFENADVREYGEEDLPCPAGIPPAYASPERLSTGGEDTRGDIFSLGVSMYELFAGELPFDSFAPAEEHYRLRQAMAFEPLKNKVPGIPDYFSALVNTMLAFDGDHRPDYPLILTALERLSRERI